MMNYMALRPGDKIDHPEYGECVVDSVPHTINEGRVIKIDILAEVDGDTLRLPHAIEVEND